METPRIPPQRITLDCPVCGMPIQAELYSLIDVGLQPELKGKFLRGRINAARCANCGSEGIIAAPLMYHDPAKELLLVFIPPESQMNDQEQQQMIGRMTNLIMAYLPLEQRKGYLLLPKVLLSYPSLIETVLQAEGITPEMLAAQRERMELVERLWQAMSDEARFDALITELDAQLDFEFFATLGAYIESNRQDGREDRVQALEGLRERLLEKSTYGRKLAVQMLTGPAGPPPLGRAELLEKVLAAGSEEEETWLVGAYRSTMDYLFFQMLAERIEQAGQAGLAEEEARLQGLRGRLLQAAERLDQEARAALERASDLLRDLLNAPDAEALIRERLDEFDDAFFLVLGANMQAAQSAKNEAAYQRLRELGGQVIEIAQEKLPPPVRLVQRLLNAPDDEAVRALLRENDALVNADLVALLRELASESEGEGETEIAARLGALADMAQRWQDDRSRES